MDGVADSPMHDVNGERLAIGDIVRVSEPGMPGTRTVQNLRPAPFWYGKTVCITKLTNGCGHPDIKHGLIVVWQDTDSAWISPDWVKKLPEQAGLRRLINRYKQEAACSNT